MKYRLLGPLDVLVEESSIEIEGRRSRVVLAMLLLNANRVVPVTRLIDALWDEDPPATARSQVHIGVSTLRRIFAALAATDVIIRRPPGYLIQVSDDDLDLFRFKRLCVNGRRAVMDQRPEEGVRYLRAALGLWRGPAATGVDSQIVQTAVLRLNEDRITALEDCFDLEADLGRHRNLIGELTELVAKYPLRERFRAQLVLALYRDGRPADALASLREARQTFVQELGLDLGEDLRELERMILENDPALKLAEDLGGHITPAHANVAVVPRHLPAAVADFTGRADLLNRLIRMFSRSDRDDEAIHVPVAALTGKCGVGKTALALQAAHRVSDVYPDGQLYAQLQEEGKAVEPARVLRRFQLALGVAPPLLSSNVDELGVMYRSLLADRRILVVLDDAYSAEQVLPLLPGGPGCGVIVTSRSSLSELPGASRFEVEVFDELTGLELLARVMGPDRVRHDAAASSLVQLCGGLPLALRVVAAKLVARPHWTIRQMIDRLSDEKQRLSELAYGDLNVRARISMSYARLGDAAKRLFQQLALLGPGEFAPWSVASLLDTDLDTAYALMDQLVEAHLVGVHTVEDGSVRFQLHDLFRVYACEQLDAAESAR